MILFGREITGNALRVGAAVLIVIIAVLALKLPGWLGRTTEDRRDRVEQGQSGAAIEAGEIGINTMGNVIESREATDYDTAAAQKSVRDAAEGQKGATTVREACRFKANRNKPECKQ